MIESVARSFAYAFVRSAAGVAAVAAAPYAIHALRNLPRAYHRTRIAVANRAVKWGQRVGCESEEKLFRKGE